MQTVLKYDRRHAAWGLLIAVVLVVGTLTQADPGRPRLIPVAFQELEAGMLHQRNQCACEAHDCCAVGFNNAFGHYTKKVTWTSVTPTLARGVVEWKFDKGLVLQGTVELSAPNKQGIRTLTLQITSGSGSCAYLTGTATGQLKCNACPLGLETYTSTSAGILVFPDNRTARFND